ncbi:MAG: hypothetical protein ACLFV5_11980 [Anaerolineales bacterium]
MSSIVIPVGHGDWVEVVSLVVGDAPCGRRLFAATGAEMRWGKARHPHRQGRQARGGAVGEPAFQRFRGAAWQSAISVPFYVDIWQRRDSWSVRTPPGDEKWVRFVKSAMG